MARSEMTPPGPTGAELERVGTSETNGVENSCSAVVMLLQCTTKNGDAIQNHRGCRVIRAHGMSHAPPPMLRFGSVSNRRSFFDVHDAMITKLLDLIRPG